MASPNLTTEVSARLQLPLVQPVRTYRTETVQFDDAKTQSWRLSTVRFEAWRLSYRNQNETEFNALRAFHDARSGSYELFYWNNPDTDEVDIPVKFDWETDSFTWSWDENPATRSVELLIRRVTP